MEDDPPYDIAVARLGGPTPVSDQQLIEAISFALRSHQVRSASISVALVDDARMAELNRRHLSHDGPTDVLTFDLREEPDGPLEGEIILSVDTARREADRRGHGPDAELRLYAVHGALHLLGYDDQDTEDAARMHEKEDEILSSIGVGLVFRAKPS